jgi:8-oxo-dGTP pyrophosphatase MutT (NUDIX family)
MILAPQCHFQRQKRTACEAKRHDLSSLSRPAGVPKTRDQPSSLSILPKTRDQPSSLQTGGQGEACVPLYKSAGGILRHQTKFGDYRYALVQGHRHKKWSFPKGHLQDKETPYTCALREIAEETGITFLPFPVTSLQIGFGYYYIFEVEAEYPLHPRDNEEIMATKWVSLQEMRDLDTNTDVSTFVRLAT